MVEKCIEMSKALGVKAIRLDAVPGNLPAIKLYEKHGFTFAGEKDLERNIEGIPTFKLYEYNL
jgi:ribosomal protein S18 acetylase RimI-like enzyme